MGKADMRSILTDADHDGKAADNSLIEPQSLIAAEQTVE
jgi:hypothetical protein